MALEELSPTVMKAKYKRIGEKRKNVRVYLPDKIVSHLELKDEGEFGFKMVRLKDSVASTGYLNPRCRAGDFDCGVASAVARFQDFLELGIEFLIREV